MRVLQVHNYHVVRGGSDTMFDATVAALRGAGDEVILLTRDSKQIRTWTQKAAAGLTSFHSAAAVREVARILHHQRPDVVHVHNVYPLLSPSIVARCSAAGVPVVMRLADYTLFCATSHQFRQGTVCSECIGGREYRCVLHNCRGEMLTSVAYAARTAVARWRRVFSGNVTTFTVPTDYVRRRYVAAGYDDEKIAVLPNCVPLNAVSVRPSAASNVVFCGRVHPSKGIDLLLKAAVATGMPFVIAGPLEMALPALPANVQYAGALDRSQVSELLQSARMVVVPSLAPETFSLACAEGMAAGVPVVASRVGGIPEVVGESGLLFDPKQPHEFVAHIRKLCADGELVDRLGLAGRQRAATSFSERAYSTGLRSIYAKAIADRGAVSTISTGACEANP